MPEPVPRKYLSGAELYGDDVDPSEIAAWHSDEKEGYADLGAKNSGAYRYSYHALNARHGFRHLPDRTFNRVLGLGSARGDEFQPIAQHIEHLTIVDPSDSFIRSVVHGVPVDYVKPEVSGDLLFSDDSFELITCLGVLHHIPNVSHIVRELFRCLQPGGFALLREPVVSMGDWTRPRRGLTRRERGIPLHLFRKICKTVGFEIVNEKLCVFPLIPRLWKWMGRPAYNDPLATALDSALCAAFRWNLRYHRTHALQKFSPTAVYTVLTKS